MDSRLDQTFSAFTLCNDFCLVGCVKIFLIFLRCDWSSLEQSMWKHYSQKSQTCENRVWYSHVKWGGINHQLLQIRTFPPISIKFYLHQPGILGLCNSGEKSKLSWLSLDKGQWGICVGFQCSLLHASEQRQLNISGRLFLDRDLWKLL